jgi:site-specific recombinase XerD
MVSFYLRDKTRNLTSVYCSINLPGTKRICLAIPNCKINPKDWEKGSMKTGRGRIENGRVQVKLDNFKRRLDDFFDQYHQFYSKYPSDKQLYEFLESDKSVETYFNKREKIKIDDLFHKIIQRRESGKELNKGKNFKYQSITLYKSTLKAIKGFQDWKGRKFIYVEEFESKKMIEDFEIYLTTELDMMINTIGNKMKTLKSFLQIAWSDGIIQYNPFKKHGIQIYTEETDAIVFTKEEMLELEELNLSDNPYHDRIRDQYLIYLWSGIRKSDLRNLLAVVNPHSNSFTFRTEKTGELCTIPAFDTLKRVAEKYNYTFPEPVSDNDVLREIKVICKRLTTMNNNVEKKYTRGGQKRRDIKKKYELVVIHTARRTLATQLVEHGLPYEQVMRITGHKKLSTLQKYIKSDSNIEQMLEVGRRIRR